MKQLVWPNSFQVTCNVPSRHSYIRRVESMPLLPVSESSDILVDETYYVLIRDNLHPQSG